MKFWKMDGLGPKPTSPFEHRTLSTGWRTTSHINICYESIRRQLHFGISWNFGNLDKLGPEAPARMGGENFIDR